MGRSARDSVSTRSIILIVVAIVAALVAASYISQLTISTAHTSSTGSTTSTPSGFSVQAMLSHTQFGKNLMSPQSPAPVGIASYGLSNSSGIVQPYLISTSEVVGRAYITALSVTTAWNDTIYPDYVYLKCDQCASLQMNVNLIVRTSGGNQSFWVQNVLGFSNISEHEIGGLFGLILNQTTPNSNMSSNTQGTGNLGGLGNRTAYGFGSLGLGSGIYSLPLNITISTSVQFPRGANDVEVSLSDKPLAPSQSGIYFKGFNETAYLPISNVTSASIVVTPYETVSYGSMRSLMGSYDAELVWASYCCGQTTKFLSMSSTLSLSYLESEGQLTVFPAFYTFGVDTAESAINLHVSPIDGGGSLTTGNTNNTFLGN